MFGLFQTDIPIGRKLWVMVLIFVLVGASTNSISSFAQDPVLFATQLLLFFGYVFILSFFIALVPGLIGQAIERDIERRRITEINYASIIRPQVSQDWFEILANSSFVVAVLISIPSFGNLRVNDLGGFGLTLFLVSEIFDFNLFYEKSSELIELRENGKGKLLARILDKRNDEVFSFKSDFIKEVRQLIDYKWDLIDMTVSNNKSKAIFQRYIQGSRLDILRSRYAKVRPKSKSRSKK